MKMVVFPGLPDRVRIQPMEGTRQAPGHASLREGGGAATDRMPMDSQKQAAEAVTGGVLRVVSTAMRNTSPGAEAPPPSRRGANACARTFAQVCMQFLLFALLLVTGCTPRSAPPPETASPVRIVSFLPSATETLYALGLGPCVVGRSSFCDHPPEAGSLPVVGDLFSANEAILASLRPTHAVLGRADAPQAPLLRALGCEIIEGRAETASDVLAFADTLGRLFPDRTNGLASAGSPWRTAMEELACTGRTETTGTTERVLIIVSHAPGRYASAFAAGEGTFHDELLRAAGLSNALSGVRGYPSLDPDRIASLSPDILIDIHPDASPPDDPTPWTYLPSTRIEFLSSTAALRPGPRLPDVLLRFRVLAERSPPDRP